MKRFICLFIIAAIFALMLVSCTENEQNSPDIPDEHIDIKDDEPICTEFSYDSVPAYSGLPYVSVNGGIPFFTEDEKKNAESYEKYGELDTLKRCTAAVSCVGRSLMPEGKRDNISSVKPTAWHSDRYEFVDGRSLYNRCHLIGFQLTGENANPNNLITGTRYMNTMGMILFENMVADFVKETDNHVLYRVTPVFVGNELLARGVLMEGYSVEDEGESVCFCAFAYNVQPGVIIDYNTGDNKKDPDIKGEIVNFVLNRGKMVFHNPDCEAVKTMKQSNKDTYTGTREILVAQGYTPCKSCKP